MTWSTNIIQLKACLSKLQVTNNDNVYEVEHAFQKLVDKTRGVRERKNSIYLIGNGASSSMASHVAADLAKNAQVQTQVFTDLSLITAVANDISYDDVFSEPLKFRIRKGDMLVAISSSGNSRNVLKASQFAAENGNFTVTLSAMSPENSLRKLGHLNFYIPANNYGLAETGHNSILHYWIDLMTSDQELPITNVKERGAKENEPA
jgi:D-sedoheptulose 7-phosphate isomerase